jgi:hypothetical protein
MAQDERLYGLLILEALVPYKRFSYRAQQLR